MRKIPTIFERWDDDRSRVLDKMNPTCAWVFAGEGVATRKYDGVCTMIRAGRLYKRYELKSGRAAPADWEPSDDVDAETGNQVGWVPVREGAGAPAEDRWMLEALVNTFGNRHRDGGTYEFVGPESRGNVESFEVHLLIRHGARVMANVPRSWAELRGYLIDRDIEGIVWHHADGRMGKIKSRDFGLTR